MGKKYRSLKQAFLEVLGEEESNLDESTEYRRIIGVFSDKVAKRFQTPLKEEEKEKYYMLFEVVCTYRFYGDEFDEEFNEFVLEKTEEEAKKTFKKLSEQYHDNIAHKDCSKLLYAELKAKEVEPLNG